MYLKVTEPRIHGIEQVLWIKVYAIFQYVLKPKTTENWKLFKSTENYLNMWRLKVN